MAPSLRASLSCWGRHHAGDGMAVGASEAAHIVFTIRKQVTGWGARLASPSSSVPNPISWDGTAQSGRCSPQLEGTHSRTPLSVYLETLGHPATSH